MSSSNNLFINLPNFPEAINVSDLLDDLPSAQQIINDISCKKNESCEETDNEENRTTSLIDNSREQEDFDAYINLDLHLDALTLEEVAHQQVNSISPSVDSLISVCLQSLELRKAIDVSNLTQWANHIHEILQLRTYILIIIFQYIKFQKTNQEVEIVRDLLKEALEIIAQFRLNHWTLTRNEELLAGYVSLLKITFDYAHYKMVTPTDVIHNKLIIPEVLAEINSQADVIFEIGFHGLIWLFAQYQVLEAHSAFECINVEYLNNLFDDLLSREKKPAWQVVENVVKHFLQIEYIGLDEDGVVSWQTCLEKALSLTEKNPALLSYFKALTHISKIHQENKNLSHLYDSTDSENESEKFGQPISPINKLSPSSQFSLDDDELEWLNDLVGERQEQKHNQIVTTPILLRDQNTLIYNDNAVPEYKTTLPFFDSVEPTVEGLIEKITQQSRDTEEQQKLFDVYLKNASHLKALEIETLADVAHNYVDEDLAREAIILAFSESLKVRQSIDMKEASSGIKYLHNMLQLRTYNLLLNVEYLNYKEKKSKQNFLKALKEALVLVAELPRNNDQELSIEERILLLNLYVLKDRQLRLYFFNMPKNKQKEAVKGVLNRLTQNFIAIESLEFNTDLQFQLDPRKEGYPGVYKTLMELNNDAILEKQKLKRFAGILKNVYILVHDNYCCKWSLNYIKAILDFLLKFDPGCITSEEFDNFGSKCFNSAFLIASDKPELQNYKSQLSVSHAKCVNFFASAKANQVNHDEVKEVQNESDYGYKSDTESKDCNVLLNLLPVKSKTTSPILKNGLSVRNLAAYDIGKEKIAEPVPVLTKPGSIFAHSSLFTPIVFKQIDKSKKSEEAKSKVFTFGSK